MTNTEITEIAEKVIRFPGHVTNAGLSRRCDPLELLTSVLLPPSVTQVWLAHVILYFPWVLLNSHVLKVHQYPVRMEYYKRCLQVRWLAIVHVSSAPVWALWAHYTSFSGRFSLVGRKHGHCHLQTQSLTSPDSKEETYFREFHRGLLLNSFACSSWRSHW